MTVRTPEDVLGEIRACRAQLDKAPDALHDAQLAAERAELAAKLAEDKAFLTAEGSIPERSAIARQASTSERDAAFIAAAQLGRVRQKIRGLETSMVSLQTELKWLRQEGA